MQEADEQDTCRICSAPAEHDQPLFHPCKCSGTIRYIHQDCLTTWLAHSKKKNCDVCKHPYLFTKVYAPDMPSTLPPLLLIRRLAQHIFLAILFVLRGILVATIWLGVLPLVTVWTWRMYFSMGESTAWWISDRPRPSVGENQSILDNVLSETIIPRPKSFPTRVIAHPLWLSLSADIFTGQMIASLIVLTFVAVFLLREWISQNARPGVFEEEEALPDEPPPARPPPNPQPVPLQPQAPGQQHQEAAQPQPQAPTLVQLPQHQLDTIQPVNVPQKQQARPINIDADRWFTPQTPPIQDRRQKKKSRASHSDTDDDGHSSHRPRMLDSEDASPQQRELNKRKMFHRRTHVPRTTAAARRRGFTLQKSSSSTPLAVPEQKTKFNFTFKAPTIPLTPGELSSVVKSSVLSSPMDANSSLPSSPFPSVALQQPSTDIPFPLRRWQQMAPNDSGSFVSQSYSLQPSLQPSLPAATRSLPSSNSSFLFSAGRTPTDSPSLATYCPPEGLQAEAGPSNPSEYLNQRKEHFNDELGQEFEVVGEESEEEHTFGHLGPEHGRYFRDPDDMGSDGEEIEEVPDLQSSQEFLSDTDSGEDIGQGGDADDQARRREDEGPAAVDDDDDEDDDGLFHEGEDEDEEPDVGEELFDQWDENEGEAGVIGPRAPRAAAGALARGNQAGGAAPAAAAVGDNEEGNVEDDIEGAMEAIGMRGPIYGVIQNAALMIFVLDTAIGLGIWIPFTVGKTTALLSLDPRRFLQVLHLPIRGMRFITDPLVDSVVYIIVKLLFPRLANFVQTLLRLFMSFIANSARELLGNSTTSGISEFSARIYNDSAELMSIPMAHLSAWTSASNLTQVASKPSNSTADLMSSLPDYLGFTEPYFALLGSKIRLYVTQVQSTWIRLALGSGPTNRAFAVCLGYVVVCLAFCLYLNVLTVGNARNAGIVVRNAVRQQLLVLKVAAFIFIELVTFPLGCGIVLDLCTVWLFPEANMQSRATFFVQAPLTAMFYHWVAGTMFMYSFAVLLSGCRSVMRPGAMWFIKDPQDQNSHPIRDILDRPALTQLRKICVSGIMYSFVVVCVVGSVAGLLVIGSKSIMPFRWKNREPLSNVPVDLLFLHLVLPYTMHYFRPKRVIKHVATYVWKFLATKFRLTSYFFGGRYPEEEYAPKIWRALLNLPTMDMVDVGDVLDGSFRRVPATDNIALPRDMRATVAVTVDGEPVDDAARELMASQDAEANKAKRSVKDDYMIVYLPPFFRYRVIGFITLLWIFGAVFIGFAVALPIQLGRSFFKLFISREVHDGYSFIIGFYLVWICYLFARAIDRLDKRRQRRGGHGPRADLYVLVLKRGLLWGAKITYMMLLLGIVVPILLAIVIDLYIVLPIRFTLDPKLTPRIRIVDAWALGLLYAKIAFHAHRIQPPNRITRGLQQVVAQGWTRPDPVFATKEVIGPLVGGLLGMIFFPGLVFRTVQCFLPGVSLDNRFMFMHVYPTVFVFAATLRSAVVAFDLLSSWSQAIRDKEFLVEMKLRNHEPELENKVHEKGKVKAVENRLPPLELVVEE